MNYLVSGPELGYNSQEKRQIMLQEQDHVEHLREQDHIDHLRDHDHSVHLQGYDHFAFLREQDHVAYTREEDVVYLREPFHLYLIVPPYLSHMQALPNSRPLC